MTETNDPLLIRAVDGDQEALSELLMCYGQQVRNRLVGKIAKQWQSVLCEDDVMQVTYMEAFLQIRRFVPAGDGAFLAWLTRIAENNLLDAVRELSRIKRPQPSHRVDPPKADDSCVALLDMLGVTITTPSRIAARDEASRAMVDALAQLPEHYGMVIRLYDLAGQSVKEVAEIMNRSEGAIYMLRSRAQDQLRELMGSESNFFSHKP